MSELVLSSKTNKKHLYIGVEEEELRIAHGWSLGITWQEAKNESVARAALVADLLHYGHFDPGLWV